MSYPPSTITRRYVLPLLCALLIGLPLGSVKAISPGGNLNEPVAQPVQGGPDRKASFKNQAGVSSVAEYVGGQVQKANLTDDVPTEGNVGVRLTVEANGVVRNVKITEPLHPAVDKEVVRILQTTSGKWLPALKNGKAVAEEVSLLLPASVFTPVEFPKNPQNTIYTYVEKMPAFAGGPDGLKQFLASNIQAGGQGMVVLTFVVRQDGSLEDFQVVKSEGPTLDAEALRVAKLMQGKWSPGKQKGKIVDVRFTLPVKFPPG